MRSGKFGFLGSFEGGAPSVPSDPYWDATHLLLNFNEPVGSSVFVDDSQYGNLVQRSAGTPQTVDNPLMFDGRCLLGGNHPSKVNANLSNAEATTAFTVECYCIPKAGVRCGLFYAPNMAFAVDSGTVMILASGYPRVSAALTAGTKYHLAMTVEKRGSTTYYSLFVNGVRINEIGNTTEITITENFIVQLGRTTDSGFSYLNGYIDKYRLTLAVRYTEDFTPPDY
jgi:hypothetical protein